MKSTVAKDERMSDSRFQNVWKEAGFPEVKVSRAEIASIKAEIRKLGPDRYQEMVRVMSHPMAVIRVRLIPGTHALQYALDVLILINRLFLILAVILLFAVGWKWALAAAILWYFVLSPLQTHINYEIGARLLAVDRKLDKERSDNRKTS